MARAPDAEDLTCSVCLSIFTEPVTLGCGHSFCRGCVTALPAAQCPQCRAAFPSASDLQLLPTSHILKSLSDRARERPQPGHGPGPQEPGLCPEHEERMKLFCVTDQRLACIICRDGEAHDGHKFKPIREAAAALRRDIDLGLANVESQVNVIQNLKQTQSSEMKKAQDLSAQLEKQVQSQFEAMQQFLQRREREILNELRLKEENAVGNMSKSLSVMKKKLSECEELKESWSQIMEVTDPEMLLRRWSEEHGQTAGDLFREKTEGLAVVPSPVFNDPNLSHLQFFIWKEMLQMVEPKPDLITLQDENPFLTVSEDQRSFHYAPQSWQSLQKQKCLRQPNLHNSAQQFTFGFNQNFSGSSEMRGFSFQATTASAPKVNVPKSFSVRSTNEFSSGQHYWEVEVRLRDFWGVGVTDFFLKYENGKYFVCELDKSTELTVRGRLLKLGVYLNCSSKTLTFYDADSMERLREVRCDGLTLPVSAYFCITKKEPDTNPITVCRY